MSKSTRGICAVEDCGRPHQAKGFCAKHYQYWRIHGDPIRSDPDNQRARCSIDGCLRPSEKRGWCGAHYFRWRTMGDPEAPPLRVKKICTVSDCGQFVVGRGLCRKHYSRWRTHGDPLLGARPDMPRLCGIPDCGKKHHQVGYCRTHWYYWKTYGDPLHTGAGRVYNITECLIDECNGLPSARGLCSKHYYRLQKSGDPEGPYIKQAISRGARCAVDECDRKYFSNGYCSKHYTEFISGPKRKKELLEFRETNPPRVHTYQPWSNRLIKRIDMNGPMPQWRLDIGNCWMYTGPVDPRGYAAMKEGNGVGNQGVHRLAYRMFSGNEIGTFHIDHLCRNPSCCRGGTDTPHLELVTHAENSSRRHECARCLFLTSCPCCRADLRGCGLAALPSDEYGTNHRCVTGTFDEAFWSLVDKDGPRSELLQSNCWDWMGARSKEGYGTFRYLGRNVHAHRYAAGLGDSYKDDPRVPDHACMRRCCVRNDADHLQIVSLSENSRRRMSDCYRCNALRECPSCHFPIAGIESATEAVALAALHRQ